MDLIVKKINIVISHFKSAGHVREGINMLGGFHPLLFRLHLYIAVGAVRNSDAIDL